MLSYFFTGRVGPNYFRKPAFMISKWKAAKAVAESDKAFAESILSLLEWLKKAVETGRMSDDEATQYFTKEFERRQNQIISRPQP